MLTRYVKIGGIILSMFILISFHNCAWGARIISLTSDPYCPFSCDTKVLGSEGYMVDVARVIFKEAGYDVRLVILPWSRCIYEVRAGKWDGVVACFKNHAPDFVFPRAGLGVSQAKFYVRKDNPWRYNGIESLKRIKFGIVQGYDYPTVNKYIRSNPEKVYISSGENALEINIKQLVLGNIDVIKDNELVVKCNLLRLNLSGEIIEAGINNAPDSYYIAFSPKRSESQEYAEIISDGIEKMRRNGKLAEILNRYGLKDWK